MDFRLEEMQKGWLGRSVGLEQQPSKLRVMGSSPIRITMKASLMGGFHRVCQIPHNLITS